MSSNISFLTIDEKRTRGGKVIQPAPVPSDNDEDDNDQDTGSESSASTRSIASDSDSETSHSSSSEEEPDEVIQLHQSKFVKTQPLFEAATAAADDDDDEEEEKEKEEDPFYADASAFHSLQSVKLTDTNLSEYIVENRATLKWIDQVQFTYTSQTIHPMKNMSRLIVFRFLHSLTVRYAGRLVDDMFSKLYSLQYLHIMGADFKTSEPRSLSGLNVLKMLVLSVPKDNKRSAPKSGAMLYDTELQCLQTPFPQLQKLVIGHDNLSTGVAIYYALPKQMAQYMPQLHHLDASNAYLAAPSAHAPRYPVSFEAIDQILTSQHLRNIIPTGVVYLRCNVSCQMAHDVFRHHTHITSLIISKDVLDFHAMIHRKVNTNKGQFEIDCRYMPKLTKLDCRYIAPRIAQYASLNELTLEHVDMRNLGMIPTYVQHLTIMRCTYVNDDIFHDACAVKTLTLIDVRYDPNHPHWFKDPFRVMRRLEELKLIGIRFTLEVNPFMGLDSLRSLKWDAGKKDAYLMFGSGSDGLLNPIRYTIESVEISHHARIRSLASEYAEFPHLKTLSCSELSDLHYIIEPYSDVPPTEICNFPALKTLKMRHLILHMFSVQQMPHLETLHFFRVDIKHPHPTMFDACANLIELDCAWHEWIVDRHFAKLISLQKLDCSGCKQVTDRAFSTLQSLQILNCSACDLLTDRAFLPLHRLRDLRCSFCKGLISTPFKTLHRLTYLQVTDCPNLRLEAFPDDLIDHLQELDLEPNEFIPNTRVALLRQQVQSHATHNTVHRDKVSHIDMDDIVPRASGDDNDNNDDGDDDDREEAPPSSRKLPYLSGRLYGEMIPTSEGKWDLLPPTPRRMEPSLYVFDYLNVLLMTRFLDARYNKTPESAILCTNMPGMYGEIHHLYWISSPFSIYVYGGKHDTDDGSFITPEEKYDSKHSHKILAKTYAQRYVDACAKHLYAIIYVQISSNAIRHARANKKLYKLIVNDSDSDSDDSTDTETDEDDDDDEEEDEDDDDEQEEKNQPGSHATLIFVDKPNRTLEFWDPNGACSTTGGYNNYMPERLRDVFAKTEWRGFDIKVNSIDRRGIQSYHATMPYFPNYGVSSTGICMTASLIMADIRMYHATQHHHAIQFEQVEERISKEMPQHITEWRQYFNGIVCEMANIRYALFARIVHDMNVITSAGLSLRDMTPDLVDFAWLYTRDWCTDDLRRIIINYTGIAYNRLISAFLYHDFQSAGPIPSYMYRTSTSIAMQYFPLQLYTKIFDHHGPKLAFIDVEAWYTSTAFGARNTCMAMRIAFEQICVNFRGSSKHSWSVCVDTRRMLYDSGLSLRVLLKQKEMQEYMEKYRIPNVFIHTIQCRHDSDITTIELFTRRGDCVFEMVYNQTNFSTIVNWKIDSVPPYDMTRKPIGYLYNYNDDAEVTPYEADLVFKKGTQLPKDPDVVFITGRTPGKTIDIPAAVEIIRGILMNSTSGEYESFRFKKCKEIITP